MRGVTSVRDMGGPVFGLKRAIDEGIAKSEVRFCRRFFAPADRLGYAACRNQTINRNWCSVLYYVTIKRDEKVLAARRVSQGMAGSFSRGATQQMMPSRRARREPHKSSNPALQPLLRGRPLTAGCALT